uniref:Uncharacterized protein n=1 Tax=Strigamia maritima TaxID=126957 RepID=T1J8A0_STRMM
MCLRTPAHPSSSLSTGSILVIILAVIIMIYFIGGMFFLHFFKGANGLEMIPHYEFWIDLPVLIKVCLDGILFMLNGCKAEPSYDRI